MSATLFVAGMSHRSAPVELREALALEEDKLREVLAALGARGVATELMILSTCNRVEVYGVADVPGEARAAAFRALGAHRGMALATIDPHLVAATDADAIRHAFRVAASLDSLVVGESQILGQVKDAFALAQACRTVGPVLNALMSQAFSVAKRVRTETEIGRLAVSVSSTAVELARKIFGSLEGKAVLLLGAGEVAELAARLLVEGGAMPLYVANRTPARARDLAATLAGKAVTFADVPAIMAEVDVVIACTAAPEPVVRVADVRAAVQGRRSRPLFVIDLGVPRNVEGAVNDLDGVFCYDVDDLQQVVRREPAGAPARGPARGGAGGARGREVPRPPPRRGGGAHHRLATRAARGDSSRRARQGARPAARRHRGDASGAGGAVPVHREQGAARADREAARLLARRPRPPLDRGGLRDLRAPALPGRARPVKVRLGTRGSRLALAQAEAVAAGLRAQGADVEIIAIRTSGDQLAQVALADFGGKALFVKEIEEALLDGRVDVAVHSLKDMPAALPGGLHLAAFPPREDPADALVTRAGGGLATLPNGARVGTSSLRRRVLLRRLRPDLRDEPIRGNVDTRLQRLAEGRYDAIVLACAGLRRLGLAPAGAVALPPDEFLPAAGQGILGVEARDGDGALLELLATLDHTETRIQAEAERAFLLRLGAGCHTPVAGFARQDGAALSVSGLVASEDGRTVLTAMVSGAPSSARALGEKLADELLARGAGALLAADASRRREER